MNLYGVIALISLIVVLGFAFDLAPAIKQFADRIADIPEFTNKGRSPAVLDFAVRCLYILAIVAIIKIIFRRRGDDS